MLSSTTRTQLAAHANAPLLPITVNPATITDATYSSTPNAKYNTHVTLTIDAFPNGVVPAGKKRYVQRTITYNRQTLAEAVRSDDGSITLAVATLPATLPALIGAINAAYQCNIPTDIAGVGPVGGTSYVLNATPNHPDMTGSLYISTTAAPLPI